MANEAPPDTGTTKHTRETERRSGGTEVAEHQPSHRAGGVIIDLGKHSRKSVKELKDGAGPLMAEVLESLDELRAEGRIAEGAQPVVVLVERKKRKRDSSSMWFDW